MYQWEDLLRGGFFLVGFLWFWLGLCGWGLWLCGMRDTNVSSVGQGSI